MSRRANHPARCWASSATRRICNCGPKVARRLTSQGAAMLMTLVMLMMLGLGSSVLMQSALHTDRTALGVRVHQQARQAATLALQNCAALLIEANCTLPVLPPAAQGQHWQRWANWHGLQRRAQEIPAASLPTAPQCLAELELLADGSPVVRLTTRGFSPDYRADARGRTLAGAVAWQQELLLLADAAPQADMPVARPPPDERADSPVVIHDGEGVQSQPIHTSLEASVSQAGTAPAVASGGRVESADAGNAGAASADAGRRRIVLDRLWRPLLNPPRPAQEEE